LLLLALACGVLGQNVLSTTSTVPPEAIVNLDDDDFQLFLAGREPKAFSGSTTSSNSSVTTSTTARTTTPPTTPPMTLPMSPSTTTTSPRPQTPSTTTTPPRPRTPSPTTSTATTVTRTPMLGGRSLLGESTPTVPNTNVLGQQFRPAGRDFTNWLMQQMNKFQEVTPVPQHVPGQEQAAVSTTARPTTMAPFPAFSSGQPSGHQQSLRSQLQTSQQLTDRLLTLWTPSGSYIQTDGLHYTPPAVFYQTPTVTYENDGVSHNNHYPIHHHDLKQQQQQLPFPESSPYTDTYLSYQKPARQPGAQSTTSSGRAPIAVDHVSHSGAVFYSDGNYYYTRPEAPPLPQIRPYELQHVEKPFLINYP
ncbi:uncharacterized protein LOC128276707, partial [Anopheles cruzii]|uniref:uncharacterized protein LOC128276707 n=1 Tax=Anopheles cruzii TaxID=68878 RepID=UPI0022EC53E8